MDEKKKRPHKSAAQARQCNSGTDANLAVVGALGPESLRSLSEAAQSPAALTRVAAQSPDSESGGGGGGGSEESEDTVKRYNVGMGRTSTGARYRN